MNLYIDPSEFAPLIEADVETALSRLLTIKHTASGAKKVLLTKAEAARELGVSISTVDRWRKEAELPFVKLDSAVLFRPESLRDWAGAREEAVK